MELTCTSRKLEQQGNNIFRDPKNSNKLHLGEDIGF